MKKSIMAFALLVPSLVLALPARGRQRGWFVEGELGFSLLAPGDLNERPDGQQALTDFTYRAGYEALQRIAGGSFTYSLAEAEGSGLEGIHGGWPVSLRVGRALGPRVAAYVGLQFLGRRRTSTLQQDYRVRDGRPDQVTPGDYRVEIAYPDYFLAASAWIPQLGVTVELARKKKWTAGVRLSGGPMFASVRLIEAQRLLRTEADGYWTESRYALDMKGRGAGVALEALARLGLALAPRLGLHVEAGYALRRGARFTGPGSYEYQYRDANAARDPLRYEWQSGEWRTRRLEVRRLWGDLAYTLSGNDLANAADSGKFHLDLSGAQLSVGLALAL